jgi:hypothetical protein
MTGTERRTANRVRITATAETASLAHNHAVSGVILRKEAGKTEAYLVTATTVGTENKDPGRSDDVIAETMDCGGGHRSGIGGEIGDAVGKEKSFGE